MDLNAEGRSLLVIAAHPDDPEFSAGGTVARWIREGGEARYVICTDGAAGGSDPAHTPEWIRDNREREQREAAGYLGVKGVLFLRYKDGEMVPDLELRRNIARQVRALKPDVALIPNPVRHWGPNTLRRNHPDHLAVGEAALAALYPGVGNAWTFMELLEEGLEPHTVPEIWVSNTDQGQFVVDVTSAIEMKIEAIRKHASQIGSFDVEGRMKAGASAAGQPYGIEYAEVFLRLTIE